MSSNSSVLATLTSRKNIQPQDDNVSKRLQAEDSFASTLLLAALDVLGPEMYEWTDEAIRLELAARRNVLIPEVNLNRLMAAIAIVTTDDFSYRLPRYIKLCNLLAGDDNPPGIFDFADPDEMAWAVAEVAMLSEELLENMSPEIQAYTASRCKAEGLARLPRALTFASEYWTADVSPEDFSDDPEMFAAVANKLTTEVDQIDGMVREGMRTLFAQISSMRLAEGNTQDLASRM